MNERLPAHNERIKEIELDTEVTARLLGALGLISAVEYEVQNPDEAPNYWKSAN